MKRLILVTFPLVAVLAACGGTTKKGCKDTGCAAGSVCNTNTGACEATATGGGTGGSGGGSTGGGSGGGGGTGGGMGTDAGTVVVDPFDDGGVFLPGDICTYAVPVTFASGTGMDGGTAQVASATVDMATLQDQYEASCGSSSGSGNDIIYKIVLAQPSGLVVTATDASDAGQDVVLSLVSSPCAAGGQAVCVDDSSRTSPEVMTVPRVPAGTWYVLVDEYGTSSTPGSLKLDFELTDPTPGPANDSCSTAQELVFANDAASATGTTVGAFNDTAGSPLTCSSGSATNPDVFYKFTLTAPHDVRVTLDTPTTSNLYAAFAITNVCGVGTSGVRGCETGSSMATFTAKGLQPGTYYLVVDGASSGEGEFSLDLALLPPTAVPTNDTCASPATLAPNVSQMVDTTLLTQDYEASCRTTASGGDAVYQFTTTQAQKVTITATSSDSDAVLALRTAPCAMSSSEIACADFTSDPDPEVIIRPALPAGTYFVVLTGYGTSPGNFGITLTLEAPLTPPANDTCTAPETVTLTNGMATRTVDLTAANADIDSDLCASRAAGPEVVYSVAVGANQTLTVTATGATVDPVVFFRTPTCATEPSVECSDSGGLGDPETATFLSPAAGTIFVVVKAYGAPGSVDVTFAVQ